MGLSYQDYPPIQPGPQAKESVERERPLAAAFAASVYPRYLNGELTYTPMPRDEPTETRRDRLQRNRPTISFLNSASIASMIDESDDEIAMSAPQSVNGDFRRSPPPQSDDGEDYSDMPPLESPTENSDIQDSIFTNFRIGTPVSGLNSERPPTPPYYYLHRNAFQWTNFMERCVQRNHHDKLIEMAMGESSDYIFVDHWKKEITFKTWLERFPDHLHSYVRWYNMSLLYHEFKKEYLPRAG